jgi:zinc transporter 6
MGVASLFIVNVFVEVYDTHFADTVVGFILSIALLVTILPVAVYTAKILLQTIPLHMVNHLDKCLREASTLDGVLEFRNEHFWTLGFGNLVGSLHVRIRRDANEQLVLAHLTNRLSNLVSDLTIQVFKDEWAWNPSPRVLHKDHSVLLKYSTQSPNPMISSSSSSVSSISSSPLTSVAVHTNNKLENRNNVKPHVIVDEKWVQNV